MHNYTHIHTFERKSNQKTKFEYCNILIPFIKQLSNKISLIIVFVIMTAIFTIKLNAQAYIPNLNDCLVPIEEDSIELSPLTEPCFDVQDVMDSCKLIYIKVNIHFFWMMNAKVM